MDVGLVTIPVDGMPVAAARSRGWRTAGGVVEQVQIDLIDLARLA